MPKSVLHGYFSYLFPQANILICFGFLPLQVPDFCASPEIIRNIYISNNLRLAQPVYQSVRQSVKFLHHWSGTLLSICPSIASQPKSQSMNELSGVWKPTNDHPFIHSFIPLKHPQRWRFEPRHVLCTWWPLETLTPAFLSMCKPVSQLLSWSGSQLASQSVILEAQKYSHPSHVTIFGRWSNTVLWFDNI